MDRLSVCEFNKTFQFMESENFAWGFFLLFSIFNKFPSIFCKEVQTHQEEAFAGPAAGKGKVGEGGGGLTPTLEKVKIPPNSWL